MYLLAAQALGTCTKATEKTAKKEIKRLQWVMWGRGDRCIKILFKAGGIIVVLSGPGVNRGSEVPWSGPKVSVEHLQVQGLGWLPLNREGDHGEPSSPLGLDFKDRLASAARSSRSQFC